MTTDIEDNGIIVTPEQYDDIKQFMQKEGFQSWNKFSLKFRRQHHYTISKNQARHVYINEINKTPPRDLIKKASRSVYGILNVCVFTSPYPEYTDENGVKQKQMFSCKHNCYYCPMEPDQPRSYLRDEPGVARANDCGFDCVKQFHMRLDQYKGMGHTLDKIEFEVSGGTWSEYPEEYQVEFIRDGYYAANVYGQVERERYSLEREIELNENADIHIIGLTIETRPDTITKDELYKFRKYNVTRVQIGVQHTDNAILKKINRGCTIEQSKEGIKMLLNNCFKVDIHLMPMLPKSTPEKDKEMFDQVLYDPDLQVDQWKVYPTSVVPWSVLETWYNKGKYKPYSMDELFEVLIYMKQRVHNRIRLIRIVRDINEHYILGACNVSHTRQLLHKEMEKRNLICKCIRCRSAKDDTIGEYKMKVEEFTASGCKEYFISYVSLNELTLYGFCRLRLPKDNKDQLEEIKEHALIRELHVYSTLVPVSCKTSKVQHNGFGKKLLKMAESIAVYNGYRNIAVISGVGVRNYYRQRGYELDNTYMKKRQTIMSMILCLIYYLMFSCKDLWNCWIGTIC